MSKCVEYIKGINTFICLFVVLDGLRNPSFNGLFLNNNSEGVD